LRRLQGTHKINAMSLSNSTFHLTFPWNGEWPSAEILIVDDFDIVGIGGVRKKQLLQLNASKQIVVHTHDQLVPASVREIYEQELLKTLQWLRPLKTVASEELDFQTAQRELFQKLFPLTSQTLGLASVKICNEYLQNMDWSSWLLQDHWRYFVGFLRQKFPDRKDLIDVAHWEWIRSWLEIQPFENTPSADSHERTLTLNAGLQTLSLSQENSILNKPAGLYAFFCVSPNWIIQEKSLDVYEAALIDLLNEERAFNFEQWVEMAALTEGLEGPPSQWRSKAEGLLRSGIVLG